MDRGAWWIIVHGVAKVGHNLVTTIFLNNNTTTIFLNNNRMNSLHGKMTTIKLVKILKRVVVSRIDEAMNKSVFSYTASGSID